jgi:hypothetical protein
VYTFGTGEQNRPNTVRSQVVGHAEPAGIKRQHLFEAHTVQTSYHSHPVAHPLDDATRFEAIHERYAAHCGSKRCFEPLHAMRH